MRTSGRGSWDSHPHAGSALLIVEVADSTLEKDRLIKVPPYRAAGVQEHWIVEFEARQVEVYRGGKTVTTSDVIAGLSRDGGPG